MAHNFRHKNDDNIQMLYKLQQKIFTPFMLNVRLCKLNELQLTVLIKELFFARLLLRVLSMTERHKKNSN